MSKAIYEDVRKPCLMCKGEIPLSRAGMLTNFCSETCWHAYSQQNQDRVIKSYRARKGREDAGRCFSTRRQYHKDKN